MRRFACLLALAAVAACWKGEPVEPSAVSTPRPPGSGGGGGGGGGVSDTVRWSAMTSNTTDVLNGVWGTSASNVFAVGANGRVVRFDGVEWRHEDAGTTNTHMDVWGTGPNDLFVVGVGGQIFRRTAAGWSPMPSPTTSTLYGVWGTSSSNVWAAGADGTIVRFDGTAWTLVESGTVANLRDVWGSSASDVWAVGDGRTIVRFDGTAWSIVSGGGLGSVSYQAIDGTSASTIFIIGTPGVLLARSATGFTELSNDGQRPFTDVWVRSGTDVHATAAVDAVWRWNGTAWNTAPSDSRTAMNALWGPSADTLFAVGTNGIILRGVRR